MKTPAIITVTAAILEKDGRILAARRKKGSHLGGFWELPGGKVEPDETEPECLARELFEEFGVSCNIGDFFAESIHDYGSKIIRLLGYHAQHESGDFQLLAHDQIAWLQVPELPTLAWAPADIPLVEKLVEDYHITATLAYYRDNAEKYVSDTVGNVQHQEVRQQFLSLLQRNSLILDLGCGSGRDSRFFLEQGHRVEAVDGVAEIAEQAEQCIGQPVRIQKAEELSEKKIYDGVWACASLVHIPKSRIHDTFSRVINSLRENGIWYMSFKYGAVTIVDEQNRYFNNYTTEGMKSLLERFPRMQLIDIDTSSATLRGTKQTWLNVIVKKVGLPPAIESEA